MQAVLEPYLIAAAVLLLLSVVASKISDRLGVPALLVFLAVGMLAGSDGPGGIHFDNPAIAQYAGVVALIVILFSGGLDTRATGLRGAVPIVLTTYPFLAGLPGADLIFHIVFFVVLSSVLLQGTSIPWVARRLGVVGQTETIPTDQFERVPSPDA
jgi:NhaP-type Na+/H+ and K+/H+ antiporter